MLPQQGGGLVLGATQEAHTCVAGTTRVMYAYVQLRFWERSDIGSSCYVYKSLIFMFIDTLY